MAFKSFKQLLENLNESYNRDTFEQHQEIFDKSVNAPPSVIHDGTKALHMWTMGGSYYRPLNNLLRHGSVQGTETKFNVRSALPEGEKDDIHPTKSLHGMKNAIDKLMDHTKLNTKMEGSRAIPSEVYDSYVNAAKSGDTVTDKGYTAFSTGPHVSDVRRTHTVKVVVHPGHKVLPMMHVSSAPHEGEVLVGRNSVWKPVMNGDKMEIHLQGHKD